jgi:hypothetical protein
MLVCYLFIHFIVIKNKNAKMIERARIFKEIGKKCNKFAMLLGHFLI